MTLSSAGRYLALQLAAAVGIALLALVIAAPAQTAGFLHRLFLARPEAFINGSQDNFPIVTARAVRPEGHGPRIHLLGTSVMRDAVVEQDVLNAQLQAQASWPGLEVANLASAGQNLWESWFLIHASRPAPGDVYYLFLSPKEFARSDSGKFRKLTRIRALVPTQDFFDHVAGDYGVLPQDSATPGRWELLRSLGQLSRRYVRNSVHLVANDYLYGGRYPLRPAGVRHAEDNESAGKQPYSAASIEARWRRVLAEKKHGSAAYDKHKDRNLALLEAMVRYTQARGARIYLLPQPVYAETADRLYGEAGTRLFRDLAQGPLQDALLPGVPSQLTRDDYFDPAHMNRRGRVKWSQDLVTLLNHRHALVALQQ